MKFVDVLFKKVDVHEYYPQLDQVVFRVVFNDGSDKQIVKQVQLSDPEGLANGWFVEIRDKLKKLHSSSSLSDDPLGGTVVLRFKQDQDVILEKISKFIGSVRESIRSGRMAKLSYYDIDAKVKGRSVVF